MIISQLSAAELGWIIIIGGALAAVGLVYLCNIIVSGIWSVLKPEPLEIEEQEEEEPEIEDVVNYELTGQNLKVQLQRSNNKWSAYIVVGDHRSKLELAENESLKEIMLQAFLHLEVKSS